MIDEVRRALLGASAVLMGLILAGLVTLDFLQVVLRYALGDGFVWGGDASVIALLTLAWLGAGHAWLAGSHIAIALFPQPRLVRIGADAAMIAGIVVLAPLLLQTIDAYGFIDLPSLPVTAAVKYWPIAGGALFLAVAALIDLLDALRAKAA